MTGLVAIGVASFLVWAAHCEWGPYLTGRPKK